MKRLKAWLLQWLGAVSTAELETEIETLFYERTQLHQELLLQVDAEREASRQALLKSEKDADAILAGLREHYDNAIADLIQDLNTLRNMIPSAIAQATHQPVRVLRNFREFRTVIEHKPFERTS